MSRSNSSNLWIDHIATIGMALSVVLLIWMMSDASWWLVGGLSTTWLLWELRRWWRRTRVH